MINIFSIKDIFRLILSFVGDKDKINLILTSKNYYTEIFLSGFDNFFYDFDILGQKINHDNILSGRSLDNIFFTVTNNDNKEYFKNFDDRVKNIYLKPKYKSYNFIFDFSHFTFDFTYFKRVVFDDKFNHKNNHLESNFAQNKKYLRYLKFGNNFNRPIGVRKISIFKQNIMEIMTERKYDNNPINMYKLFIPESVTELIFGDDFNQIIGGDEISFLPRKLIKLKFGKKFNQQICCSYFYYLPEKIIYLEFGDYFNKDIGFRSFKYLPMEIETLIFGKYFNKDIGYNRTSFLPQKIKKLIFGKSFNQPIGYKNGSYLSKKLNIIYFGYYFDYPLFSHNGYSYIPSSVHTITLSINYNHSTPKTIKNIFYLDSNNKIIKKTIM